MWISGATVMNSSKDVHVWDRRNCNNMQALTTSRDIEKSQPAAADTV